jgi:hypothetical protein
MESLTLSSGTSRPPSRTSRPRYGPRFRYRHTLFVATKVAGWGITAAALLVMGFLLAYPVVWGCAVSACSDVPQPL